MNIISRIRNRKTEESAFTLIELSVVIGIVGTLAAIAIPAYNGYRQKANDAAVESDSTNAVIEIESYRLAGNGDLGTIRTVQNDNELEVYRDDVYDDTLYLSPTVSMRIEAAGGDFIVCTYSDNGRRYTDEHNSRKYDSISKTWSTEPAPCEVSEYEQPVEEQQPVTYVVAGQCEAAFNGQATIVRAWQEQQDLISGQPQRIRYEYGIDGNWNVTDKQVSIRNAMTNETVGVLDCADHFTPMANQLPVRPPVHTQDSAYCEPTGAGVYCGQGALIDGEENNQTLNGNETGTWLFMTFADMGNEAINHTSYDVSRAPIYAFSSNPMEQQYSGSGEGYTFNHPQFGEIIIPFRASWNYSGGGIGTWSDFIEAPSSPSAPSETSFGTRGLCSASYAGTLDVLRAYPYDDDSSQFDYELTGSWNVSGTYEVFRQSIDSNGFLNVGEVVATESCSSIWDEWAGSNSVDASFYLSDGELGADLGLWKVGASALTGHSGTGRLSSQPDRDRLVGGVEVAFPYANVSQMTFEHPEYGSLYFPSFTGRTDSDGIRFAVGTAVQRWGSVME